ncbi:glucosaminidase domain-containing protein [Paraburkholderia lycopersici]|uniref:Flagellum-specific peptidoglycan hydrolase FlgJ n=1 Tax=Paraburkholderia lycopersici TaxID=416944 RepID=A0A1G6K373_9BURK|nr:glucosaminidase domain-containing protein [Paraburkholderia lycopersici]SDC25387.1 Flagellum-specific peptidoglycan hydrolase FlgJ [Paraburkholderia lycopersici]
MMSNYVTDPSILAQLNGGAAAPASTTPASFAAQYGDLAQAVGQKLGVDPSLILGHLGLETAWGKSVVPGTNNLGNIKDFSGSGVAARDNQTGSTDRYRTYADPQAFADDYAGLLARKYPGVVGAGSDVQKFTSGLSGYAEDPQYASKVAGATAAVKRASPGFLARVGDAVASAVSGSSNAAEPSRYVTAPALLAQLNGTSTSQTSAMSSAGGPSAPNYVTDPALLAELNGSSPSSSPEPEHTALQQLGDAASAFGHHVMAPLHGGAQLVEHGANAVVQAVAPNTAFARSVQGTVAADDAALAKWERDYQQSTPDNAGSYAGAVAGEIAPVLVAGGARAVQAGADVASGLAARLGLTGAPASVATMAGRAAGSAAVGAGYGAAQPVLGDGGYWGDKGTQAGIGAAAGAAAPVAGAAARLAGSYAGNVVGSLAAPFTGAGQRQIAENTLLRFARGGPTAVNGAQIVPGSEPTLAEATANPGIATLQRTVRDLEPNPFVAREQQNAAARTEALADVTGTAGDLEAARAARSADASDNYLATNVGIPTSDTAYAALKQYPAFQKAMKDATQMAKNAGVRSIETDVPRNQSMGGAVGQLPPETYVSGRGLQWIKQSLDDQINSQLRAGNSSMARNILGAKEQLLGLMDNNIEGYAAARQQYAQQSGSIDAVQYLQGLNLTDAAGNVTLAKVQNALRGLQKQQAQAGVNAAKSVTPAQIGVLTQIRDDLLRASNVGLGRSASGTSTAQNLAFQNILSSMLPGRVGAAVGSIGPSGLGSAVGGALGFGVGGLPGAAVGASAGGFIGRAAGGLLRGQNDAIQNQLMGLLLDPAAGGAALNGVTGPTQQTIRNALVNRLLPYGVPSITGAATAAVTRPPLREAN